MQLSILSSYMHQIINIGLRFIMIPIYVGAFGLGSYGLIGFYISMSSLLVLLDFGMGYASLKLLSESSQDTLSSDVAVLRLIEKIYLGCTFLIGFVIYFLSNAIAENWLTVDARGVDATATIQLMAFLLLVSWPQSLYQSFLMGQQKFVPMNVVMIVVNISVTMLMFIGLTNFDLSVDYYFAVMIAAMALQTIVLRLLAWGDLRVVPEQSVMKNDVIRFFSYAAGVSVFSLCSLGFFQGPLLALSSLSTTSELGLYNLAMTFPMAFITLMYPLGSVFLPKLVEIAGNEDARDKFERAVFIMASFMVAGTATLLLNMDWIYLFWVGDEAVLSKIVGVSSSLALGTLFYGFTMIFNNVLLINAKSNRLASAYVVALLWLCSCIYLFNEPFNAQTIADLWKDVSFILMCGVLFIGLVSFPSLFKAWFKSILSALSLGFLGVSIIVIVSTYSTQDSFILLVSTVLVFAILYIPKTYKIVRAL